VPKSSSSCPVVSKQYRLVTDRRTDRRTHDDSKYRASIASRGKKMYSYIDMLTHVCSLPACHFSVNKLNLLLYNQPKLMAAKNFLSCIHHPIEIQIVHKFVALFRGKESSHLSFHNICVICIKIPSSPAVFRKRSVFHPPTAIPKRC